MSIYPLKLTPFFRHGEQTPWGGRALSDIFGKAIPDDQTGESLEISALPGMESVIENGELAGKPLSVAVDQWKQDLTGPHAGEFPLLVKLLDAKETLSVQVHPDDEYAKAHEGKLGKSEAWVVLSAPPGSKLVYGVDTQGKTLEECVEAGELEQALTWLPVSPGDVLYIPHGMVHALGTAGAPGDLIIYEIQQSSDVTYRFWDWGRVDKAGNPRELHTQKALDVTRADLRLPKLAGSTYLADGGSVTAYICSEYFELSRLNVAGKMPLESGRMLLLTAMGVCDVTWGNESIALMPGDSMLIPAAMSGVSISGQLPVLCACLPDQEKLRAILGYRASAVAGLT